MMLPLRTEVNRTVGREDSLIRVGVAAAIVAATIGRDGGVLWHRSARTSGHEHGLNRDSGAAAAGAVGRSCFGEIFAGYGRARHGSGLQTGAGLLGAVSGG